METTVSQPVASDATTSARIYLDQRFRPRVVYEVDSTLTLEEIADAICKEMYWSSPGTPFDLHFVGCAHLILEYPMGVVARTLCDGCCDSKVILENPLELEVGYKLMGLPWLRALLPTSRGELRRLARAVSEMLARDPRVLRGGPTYMDSHLMALRDPSVPTYIKTAILVSYGWRLNGQSVEVDDAPRSEVRKLFWDNGSVDRH